MHKNMLTRFELLEANFPKNSDDFLMRSVCESLLPEALAFFDEPDAFSDSIPVALFMARIARFLKIKADFQTAESLARRSLEMMEKLVATNDSQLCAPLSALGNILCADERATESEAFLRRALTIAEAAYGADSEEVATALNDLGNVLYFIDEQQSEEVFRRALKIRQTVLPPNHPDTATSMSDLGAVISQDEPELAEELLRQALAIREKIYGNSHPDVAITMDNLASLLDDQQREDEALELSKRAVDIFEKCFGLRHPDVVIALRNMAIRLRDNRKEYSEAEKYYRRTKDAVAMLFGEESITIAEACYDLGVTLRMQEAWSEAEIYFRSALGIHERIYGTSHPDIAKDLNQLASVIKESGNLDDAEPLFRRALAVVEEEFIEPHPKIALALFNLAHLLQEKNCYRDAKIFYLRCLKNEESTSSNEEIAKTLGWIGLLYIKMQSWEDAVDIYRRRLSIIELKDYTNYSAVITADHLSYALFKLEQYEETISLLENILPFYKDNDYINELATAHHRMADSLTYSGRVLEAKPHYDRAVELEESLFD